MTDATISKRYRSRYPRQGRIAVLCEGDLAGFEADLLEKWTADTQYVDVWPCGTKTAIYGVSDAIGRAVPMVVIEDRDFRNTDAARKDCKRKAEDRRKREVKVVEWLPWQRHEIENYLIEPDVLVPVLEKVFGSSEATIDSRLGSVLENMHVEQAALATRADFAAMLPDKYEGKFGVGLPPAARPSWDSEQARLTFPDTELVECELKKALDEAAYQSTDEGKKVNVQQCMDTFERYRADWRDMKAEAETWRVQWAGKEVLTNIVKWLAGEFGWPSGPGENRKPVEWDKLNRAGAGAQERLIMQYLQPQLVTSLIEFLEDAENEHAIRQEWRQLRTIIANSHDA